MKRRLLLLIISLCLWDCASALTLGDTKVKVRRLIGDKANPSVKFTDDEITANINEAQRDVVTATWCLQKSTGITLSVATTYYALPSDLIAIKSVRFEDSTHRIRNISQTSYRALTENNPDYARQTGPPMQYIMRPSTGNSAGLEICFLPIPTTSSTGTATIDYFNQSTDLSSDATVLLDGDYTLFPYHELIVYDTAAKLKLAGGDPATATIFLQLYTSGISAMNSRLGEIPNLNPGLSAATSSSSPTR